MPFFNYPVVTIYFFQCSCSFLIINNPDLSTKFIIEIISNYFSRLYIQESDISEDFVIYINEKIKPLSRKFASLMTLKP